MPFGQEPYIVFNDIIFNTRQHVQSDRNRFMRKGVKHD
jgi:hypothetical protein